MKLKTTPTLAIAAACFVSASESQALTYNEVGDAGDLPSTVQIVSGTSGTPLDKVTGSLTSSNGIGDGDLFEIYISDPAAFSASLTGFALGTNNFDSQIMLFDSAGVGVIANDDDLTTGAPQSSIATANSLLSAKAPGAYYLLVVGSGRFATAGGTLVFNNFTDGTTDPTDTVTSANAGALSGYTGNSNETGAYSLALTGAQFLAVPEPSTVALSIAGALGLALVARTRRTA